MDLTLEMTRLNTEIWLDTYGNLMLYREKAIREYTQKRDRWPEGSEQWNTYNEIVEEKKKIGFWGVEIDPELYPNIYNIRERLCKRFGRRYSMYRICYSSLSEWQNALQECFNSNAEQCDKGLELMMNVKKCVRESPEQVVIETHDKQYNEGFNETTEGPHPKVTVTETKESHDDITTLTDSFGKKEKTTNIDNTQNKPKITTTNTVESSSLPDGKVDDPEDYLNEWSKSVNETDEYEDKSNTSTRESQNPVSDTHTNKINYGKIVNSVVTEMDKSDLITTSKNSNTTNAFSVTTRNKNSMYKIDYYMHTLKAIKDPETVLLNKFSDLFLKIW